MEAPSRGLRGGLGLLALVVTLGALAALLYFSLRRPSEPARPSPQLEALRSEVPGLPAGLERDPRAAQRWVAQQTCLAGCAQSASMCSAMASAQEQGEVRCGTERDQCERACRTPPPPAPVRP